MAVVVMLMVVVGGGRPAWHLLKEKWCDHWACSSRVDMRICVYGWADGHTGVSADLKHRCTLIGLGEHEAEKRGWGDTG